MTAEEIMQLDEVIGLTRLTPAAQARIDELDRLSGEIVTCGARLMEAIEEVTLAEAQVRASKHLLADAEAAARLTAYGSGEITGKNQAERDAQIAVFVSKSTHSEQWDVGETEEALTNARISRDQAEVQWKAVQYQLGAQQAIVALLTK